MINVTKAIERKFALVCGLWLLVASLTAKPLWQVPAIANMAHYCFRALVGPVSERRRLLLKRVG